MGKAVVLIKAAKVKILSVNSNLMILLELMERTAIHKKETPAQFRKGSNIICKILFKNE